MKPIRFPGKYKIFALAVGICICFIIVAVIEGLFRVFSVDERSYHRSYPTPYRTINKFGIKGAIPGTHRSRLVRKRGGEAIYDVSYQVDQSGRRIVPVTDRIHRDKFILFFGCSFTYGEGVGSLETLPYYAGVSARHYMPYNYGFHGLGPFDVLAKLETTDFKSEIEEDSGLVVYTFIDSHIRRTFCPLSNIRWQSDQLYYDIPDERRLVRKGSFSSEFPLKMVTYRILSEVKSLTKFKFDIPPRVTGKHIKNIARVIDEMDYYVKTRIPDSLFYVIFYPGQKYTSQIVPYLEQKNIHYLDCSTLFDPYSDSRFILAEEDKHPSAFAYRTLAEAIVKDLRLD